ncbi:GNAT family N-acetyltransferase [Cryobacterium lactosi]|uniref:GNAT family N-acetyltransferase n=1 Tax=Cryobacterium lactosi TaxID=1259202 RepID=A0A4R9BIX4_9MICO|nr:GNAT family N-acetyltransferase [Cryobacterium lactosi]TFD85603.1 GNAT family N-acetyltransferase [Cryobacterium lactosi]
MADIEWTLRWEADLSADDHTALAVLFGRYYPEQEAVFVGTRSWMGARPEARVIGYDAGRPVAHLGFVRRMLRLESGGSQLVGDVGLVGVDPDYQGTGLGRRLLAEAATQLQAQGLPFGFLTCAPAVVPFYASGGWRQAGGQTTRMIDTSMRPETFTGPAMVLPVTAPFSDWPAGQTIVRDGLEV